MNQTAFLRKLCSTFLLSMICLFAFSQGKQIQGVVKDATGELVRTFWLKARQME